MAEELKKGTIKNPVFWISFILCASLIVAGFIVPPTGVIDGSVLKGVGEMFAFPTLWTVAGAIDKGIDAKLTHGNTTLAIGDAAGDDEDENENEEEEQQCY